MIDVSVIIPIYNTEGYLCQCINSVIRQENVSLEIILIDDGSNDSSPKVCDEYANRFPFIKVMHIKNSGPATAKNIGLNLAQGNYIALTDSDDKMEPQMLYKMVSAGYEHDADIVCCNYKQVDEHGKISHLNATNKQYVLNHAEGLIHFFSKDKIYSQCWTKVYKRQMLVEHHISNDTGLRTDEDFIFNIRAFVKAQTTVIIDEPLYVYTYRENSLAHAYFKKNISQYINNRLQRIQVTRNEVKNESSSIKEWSIVHTIMYHNELLGKVALFPDFFNDQRIKDILFFIKRNRRTLFSHYRLCGFSMAGMLLITVLPCNLYMRYRNYKLRH